MTAPFLIIDGYNLMHAAGLARLRYGPGDLQRQRHRLLVKLTNDLTSEERIRCTVAFDAIDAPQGLQRQFRHGEITVIFAEPGHEADEVIESLIASHSAARKLLVVSSDHRLQKAAKHRRAASIDSEAFLSQLAARPKDKASRQDKPEQAAAKSGGRESDVDFWLEEFGEIDVETLTRLDEPETSPTDPWQKNLDDLQRRLDSDQGLDEWLNQHPKRD